MQCPLCGGKLWAPWNDGDPWLCNSRAGGCGASVRGPLEVSRSGAYVRFADGTIRHGIYDGSTDILQPALFGSQEEAWDAWREGGGRMWPESPDVEYLEAAVVCVTYGRGHFWPVLSSRERVHGPLEYTEAAYMEGKPTWMRRLT